MFFGQPYIVGPLVALIVVGVLSLVLRWTYGSRSAPAPPEAARDSGDFGLLREVAVVDTEDTANALRALLSDAGIRSTKSPAPDGRTRVLVFATDLDRARQLAGPR